MSSPVEARYVTTSWSQLDKLSKDELGNIAKAQSSLAGLFICGVDDNNISLTKIACSNEKEFDSALEKIIVTDDKNVVDKKINNKTKLVTMIWEQSKVIEENKLAKINKYETEFQRMSNQYNQLVYEKNHLLSELNVAKTRIKELKQDNDYLKNNEDFMRSESNNKDYKIENIARKNQEISLAIAKMFVDCVPEYNGAVGSKTEEWIFKIEDSARRLGINSNEIVGLIASKLFGGAFQIYMNAIKVNENITWNDFKIEILKTNQEAGTSNKI